MGSMTLTVHPYVIYASTALGFDDAVEATRAALADEGFGVLCQIDVRATLQEKLGVERDPYVILGACNPPLAHRALETEIELGALLPCNVVVAVQEGLTTIFAIDPIRMLGISGNPALEPVAQEVHHRLQRVIDR